MNISKVTNKNHTRTNKAGAFAPGAGKKLRGSRSLRVSLRVLLATVLFLLACFVTAFYLLQNTEQKIRAQAVGSLHTLLHSTHSAISDIWAKGHLEDARKWATDPTLIRLSEKLLATPFEPQALRESPIQRAVRDYFNERLQHHDTQGIFIIAPDYTSLASMRDANIGTKNLIALERPHILQRVLAGEPKIVAPIYSDVPLLETRPHTTAKQPTMFVATPITDAHGNTIAALAVRIDPFADFTRMAQLGRTGASGETYLFDSNGLMITESRFNDQLRALGIIKRGESSMLNVKVETPDINRVKQPISTKQPLTHMAPHDFKGETGQSYATHRDYRDKPVLRVWAWDSDLELGFASKIDENEALQPYRQFRTITFILLALLSGLVVALVYVIHRAHRKSTEAAQRGEFYSRMVMEQAADAMITITETGVVTSFNRAAEKMFGYAASEVVGHPINMLMPEPHRTNHDQYIQRYLTTKIPKVIGVGAEAEGLRKDGTIFPIRLALSDTWLGDQRIFSGVVHDLTETRQAIASLTRSEERYRRLFEDSRDAILLLNADEIFECNAAAVNMFGYDSRHSLVGRHFAELSPLTQPSGKPSRIIADGYIEEAMAKGSCFFEWVNRNRDGSLIPTEVMISAIRDGDNPIIQAVVRNISERQKSEREIRARQEALERSNQALEKARNIALSFLEDNAAKSWTEKALQELVESEERYRTLVDDFRDGFFIANPRGRFEFANPALAKILDLASPEAVVGRRLIEYVAPEQKTLLEQDFLHLITTDSALGEFEYEIGSERQHRKTIRVRASVDYAQDKPLRVRGVVTDITERRRAEQQLTKLYRAVEQSPASVIITDTRGTIEYVNPIFSETTGYSASEVIGEKPRLLRSGHTSKAEYEAMWQTIASGGEWTGEFLNQKKNGELVWESASISPVRNPEGDITHYIAVQEDITARKQAETELLQARDRAQEANRAKSAFLATMSHEIRTPMNAIIGMTHLVLQSDLDLLQQNYLEKIDNAAHLLLHIINDILDFSRVEAGELEIEAIDFDLRAVLNNVSSLVAVKIREKGLDFHIDIAPGTPVKLIGDPLRLAQILTNLVNNAVKFTESGEIRLAVKWLDKRDANRLLHFSVSDTGIGIPEATIARIFDPFSQADSSTTRQFGGSGLGLAICQRLVALMQGTIEVESEPGVGSTFTFSALFADAGAQPEEVGRQAGRNNQLKPYQIDEFKARLAGVRVLLVEDNEINQELASALLTNVGMIVDSAANGEEALGMIDRTQYDAVLMDLQMPVMDGLEATAVIRADRRFDALPVIALTANAMAEDQDRCRAVGMNDYIVKPINPNELYGRLEKWTAGKAAGTAGSVTVEPRQPDHGALGTLTTIDGEQGLARVGGDITLYKKLLRRFLASEQDFAIRYRQRLEQNASDAMVRMAHTLKGVAGNIAAERLMQLANLLEVESRKQNRENTIEATLNKVDAELSKVITEISRIPLTDEPVTGTAGKAEGQEEDFLELLGHFESLLRERDTQAAKTMEQLLARAESGRFSVTLQNRLRQQVRDYQYKQALETLKLIIAEHGQDSGEKHS